MKQCSNKEQLRDLQFAIGLFERDVRAALPRSWRDGDGRSMPALMSQSADLSLVRAGWSNPTGQNRAELEVVRYQLAGNQLQRLRWLALDRARATTPQVDTLLSEVTALRLEFLHPTRGWQQDWSTKVQTLGNASADQWPRAVRLQLRSERWGHIERVIELIHPSTTVDVVSGPDAAVVEQ